ncbi:hypothetical protein M4J06_004948 [Streptomyces coelicoflavus]|uniref:hypothetical protein n=1 Tax=Streptomyces coelicoflavus TaxID=285562 RepID=UPI0021094BFB|nr:hypothetical protein [Streptomyces coelicoflavus]MCQ4198775.1 hypothetical protein [Streptomyces coelicoflavus]
MRATSCRRRSAGALSPGPGGFPLGAPRDWPEQLAQLTVEVGTSACPLPSGHPELIRTFAEEVAPATRELVTAARARGDEPRTSRATAAGYAPRRRRPGTGSGTAQPDTGRPDTA